MKRRKIVIILIIIFLIVSGIKYKQNDILNWLVQLNLSRVENKSDYFDNANNNVGLTPEFNVENVNEATLEDYFKNIDKFNNVKYSGRLVVPSIYLNLPVFEGINSAHLLLGASEQLPRIKVRPGSVGNYILASHKMSNTKNLGFSRINRIKPGDKIYVTDSDYVYIYNTEFTKTVKNSDTKYINESPVDENIITLYTCSQFGNNTPKVIVRGRLENKEDLKDITKSEYDLLFKKK